MTIASIGRRTTNVTDTQSMIEVIAPADRDVTILEIEIIATAATASAFGLGVPQAAGVTPTTPVAFQRNGKSTDPTPTATTALAWGTPPTAPAAYMRRGTMTNLVGQRLLWQFPNGIRVPAGTTLVIANIGTTVACDVNIVIDEQPKTPF